LTAMCQASETSEWKGSVGKEIAGVDDQAGQEGKKSQQRGKSDPFVWSPFFGATIGGARGLRRSHAAPQLGQHSGQVQGQVPIPRASAQPGRGPGMLYGRVLAAPPQAPHSSALRQ
jgi:hypothetical protein